MQTYTPFLKFKQNEVAALAEFIKKRTEVVIPFFDIPRPKDSDEINILDRLRKGVKQIEKNLPNSAFYIDNFDVDDSIILQGVGQYEFILNTVSHLGAIPVVALNRDVAHNPAALNYVKNNKCPVAIRLNEEDFESYKLTKPELTTLWDELTVAKPAEIHLVIDFRVITQGVAVLKSRAVNFINSFINDFSVDQIIITGSSIPASLKTILSTNGECSIERSEWHLWSDIAASLPEDVGKKLVYGDYGFISPDYSDVEFEFWLLQKVMGPKVFYSYSTKFFIIRGGAFQTHKNGYGQYFDIADTIAHKPFYRGPAYSYGEKYIYDRSSLPAVKVKTGGSPGSWIKAGLASHITFIVDSL